MGEPFPIRAGDVKQWFYCKRIVYFTYVVPLERVVTAKMAFGAEAHQVFEQMEARRKLRAYGLESGQRHFRVRLESTRLGLTGVLDMLVTTKWGPVPVEMKHTTGRPGLNHKYQLAAYAAMAEDSFGEPVRCGFIFLVPSNKAFRVLLTDGVRRAVRRALNEIKDMVSTQQMPPPTWARGRCRDCEYRNFCRDVQPAGGTSGTSGAARRRIEVSATGVGGSDSWGRTA